jgi:recombination associated protein RdgC
MGFFSGRVSCTRFRVVGHAPGMFGPEHLERLEGHAAGTQKVLSADGVEVGWAAGDHILDTRFDLAKNVINETLHFAVRIDQQKLPADLLRAYTQVEVEALAANNPSGLPSTRQKREAKQNALARLEDEARDGRFLKRKAYPVLWDAGSNEVLVGTGSGAVIDRLHTLFQQTFGQSFEPLSAGRQAFLLAEARQQTRGVDDAEPSPFVPGLSGTQVAWVPDENSRDFLGNEFLLWLWFMLDSETDTITLSDGSQAAVMLTRTLVLECPRAQTGKETITSDGPTQLPEARRAIQAGKLPRRVGMIVVRHDQQYELTFQGENLSVSGARLPAPEAVDERARLEERVTQLRHLLETLDLLYDTFCRTRTTDDWPKELARMQKWLQRFEERTRLTATG